MLLSTSAMVGYGRHSTTERVLVNDEGLAIRSLLKIQSGPDSKDQVSKMLYKTQRPNHTMPINLQLLLCSCGYKSPSRLATGGVKSVIPPSE